MSGGRRVYHRRWIGPRKSRGACRSDDDRCSPRSASRRHVPPKFVSRSRRSTQSRAWRRSTRARSGRS